VYRGHDIYSYDYLVVTRIEILARWRKERNIAKHEQENVYIVQLLQEESVRILYQKQLTLTLEVYVKEKIMKKNGRF
jgi:hypothetical protein